jgi:hypothetical protein
MQPGTSHEEIVDLSGCALFESMSATLTNQSIKTEIETEVKVSQKLKFKLN